MRRVGVLALQGAFREHVVALQRLGAEAVEVRLPRDLDGVEGLIIPGGESTTIIRLIDMFGLREPLGQLGAQGLPIWGTCAGMILLARKAIGLDRPPPLSLMDVVVRRNAFGRQVDSFEADLPVSVFDGVPYHCVFIRAPLIEAVGAGVDVLARLQDGTVVAAQQGRLLATSFHPELTADARFHRHFLSLV